MHITILAVGSRGDIQPPLALGIGLRQAGHSVCLATQRHFEDWIRSYGLDYAPLEGDIRSIIDSPEARAWMETQRNGLRMAQGFRNLVGPILPAAMRDGLAASDAADLLIVTGPAFYIGLSIAEKHAIPAIQAYLQPIHPTSEFPSALFPLPFKGGRMVNYLSHIVGGQGFWQLMRPIINASRRDVLGLPPYALLGPWLDALRTQTPILHGFSRHILPPPRTWPSWLEVTGYWMLPEAEWTPPEDLRAFLADGEPPIYIGFGSMADRDPQRMTTTVLDAVRYTGKRALLLRGWGGLEQRDLPSNIHMVDEVPHAWLFPQMQAVVHHGGAGTTAASLHAGRPSIIVPFFGDQPFWGDRIAALGLGPTPIPQTALTAERLAGAIDRVVGDQALQERAARMGELLRSEHGVARAIDVLESYGQTGQRTIMRDIAHQN